MQVVHKTGCECCGPAPGVSSISSSSVSSSSAAFACPCGECVWFKTITETSWTQGDGTGGDGEDCTHTNTADCECPDPPPDGVPGNNCDGYKTDTIGTDTVRCYKCCDTTPCTCACCIDDDITGRLMDQSTGSCDTGNSVAFTLEYRKAGGQPSTGIDAGATVGDWWVGETWHCNTYFTVTVYCLQGEGGCDKLYAYVEHDDGDGDDTNNCVLNINAGNINSHIVSGTTPVCTCSPLKVTIGAFSGIGSEDSDCDECCDGCDPMSASDCVFSFTLELTD